MRVASPRSPQSPGAMSVGQGSLIYGSPPSSPLASSPLAGSTALGGAGGPGYGSAIGQQVEMLYGVTPDGKLTRPSPTRILDVNNDGIYTAGLDGAAGPHIAPNPFAARRIVDANFDGIYQRGVDRVAPLMGLSGTGLAPFAQPHFGIAPVPVSPGPSVHRGAVDNATEMVNTHLRSLLALTSSRLST